MTEEPPIRRRELVEVLERLENDESVGVLILGIAGSGKTVLMHMLESELRQRGRSVFYLPLRGVERPGQVGTRVLRTVYEVVGLQAFVNSRLLQSSTGAPPTFDLLEELRQVTPHLERPVLLLDALDEAADPSGTASVVEELSRALGSWQLVVSSRPAGLRSRFDHLDPVQVGPLTYEEAVILLRRLSPATTDEEMSKAFAVSGGLPLALHILARANLPDLSAATSEPWTQGSAEGLVASVVATTADPPKVQASLERLALLGGRERLTDLAAWCELTAEEALQLLGTALITVEGDGVAVMHEMVGLAVIARRLREAPFRLIDLRFGSEEAERDDLLDDSFVPRKSLALVLEQHRSIIVGDRGSGKSALFRKLSASEKGQKPFPVTSPSDLIQRLAGAAEDAETLRAVWLVVTAAVVAAAVPETAPKRLRREAADLRAAVGLSTQPVGRVTKALRTFGRLIGGTTLKFAVGPVNLEAQLPSGGRPSAATVDVEAFLKELDGLLKVLEQPVMVLFDQIDEMFKYDRVRQEAVVQGLLQVESRLGLLDYINLVIFLRTDLFELYDIQEKNKLVSRRIVLEWSEEDWLQVLVRRVLANESLGWIADRLRLPTGGFDTRAALGVIFPAEVEGRPTDRWLVDSVRNGNGDVSARLAVLLLHLSRDHSAREAENIGALPLFTADAVARAMTEVSELSFSEVVNDFKVAPSFVLNCRAGKRNTFTLAEVESLFEPGEGSISEQVRLLERLGFLERLVVETGAGAQSRFRIPELYTRCW